MRYPSMNLLGFLNVTVTTSSLSWKYGFSWYVPPSSPYSPSLYFISVSTSDKKYDTSLYAHLIFPEAAWKVRLLIIKIHFPRGLLTNYTYMVENLVSEPSKLLWRDMVYAISPILAVNDSTFIPDLPRHSKTGKHCR